jgi:prevent-host-death family protein
MSASIAQSRQQLAALIEAAQVVPQVITKRNTPVAVLVSTEYFKRTEAAGQRPMGFYDTLLALRATYLLDDDSRGEAGKTDSRGEAGKTDSRGEAGKTDSLCLSVTPWRNSDLDAPDRNASWQRENSFANE